MKRSVGSWQALRFIVAALLAAALAAVAATGASAGGPVPGADYLALGDSVAFGYVPPQEAPPPRYAVAQSFRGYPEYLAQMLHDQVSNASCPGETTASMLDVNAISNGCENVLGTGTGYRGSFPLHVDYSGSQMDYALAYLQSHDTQLVTIDIGANDAFVCQETTTDNCTSPTEVGNLATSIGTNLAAIFGQLETVYSGRIVVLTYYSLDYNDPVQTATSVFLNSVITAAAAPFHVTVADGFTAFKDAAPTGDPCAAGLLIKLPGGTCNIHPSAKGHRVLAEAIASALQQP